jgi:hypothetical protein
VNTFLVVREEGLIMPPPPASAEIDFNMFNPLR